MNTLKQLKRSQRPQNESGIFWSNDAKVAWFFKSRGRPRLLKKKQKKRPTLY